MSKNAFETIIYSGLAIGAFVVEFLPVSIACAALLTCQGARIFFEVLEDQREKKTKNYYLKKGVFILIILLMLIVLTVIFMYRNKLLTTSSGYFEQ